MLCMGNDFLSDLTVTLQTLKHRRVSNYLRPTCKPVGEDMPTTMEKFYFM